MSSFEPGAMPTSARQPDRLVDASVAVALLVADHDHHEVYDALVGATAKQHGVMLATRDRRAPDTHRALDVPFEPLP